VVAEGLRSLLPEDLATVPADVPQALLAGTRVLTTGHENPDADAIGAALGIALALEELGARVETVFADPVPAMYDFMPGIGRARTTVSPDLQPDLIVVCDGDVARTGAVARDNAELFERVPVVDIDHHLSNAGQHALAWVDNEAAATCEQVALLLPHLGLGYDIAGGDVVQLLTAGLVFDTANFAHSNTTPRTLRVAAELVAAGAELPLIARRIYRTKPNAQLKLFGRVLARLDTAVGGRVTWSVVTAADYEAAGASQEQAEGLIDLLAQSASAEVTILFKDLGDEVRISIRTRDDGVDATRLAGAFGGGGHARAAGASHEGPFPIARDAVLSLAGQLLDELRRRQARRTHLARRHRHHPTPDRRPSRRPRRHARSVRHGCAAGVHGQGHTHGRLPPRGRQDLPRLGRLRGQLHDRRYRR
jgi:phosphoesterase RecJ-like protein